MASPREVVARAREVLERDGWCQDEAHGSDGSHCTMGALGLAYDELFADLTQTYTAETGSRVTVRATPYSAVISLITEQIMEDYPDFAQVVRDQGVKAVSIPCWNDDLSRTVDDVMLLLKRAEHDG